MQDPHDVPSGQTASKRRAIAVAIVAVVAVAVIVVVAGSTSTACEVCHKSQAVAMQSGDHATSGCYDCHLAGGDWGYFEHKVSELTEMYPAALLGRTPSGPATLTHRDSCLQCHQEILEITSASRGLRIDHARCATASSCDGCHAGVAHGDAVRWQTTPIMDDCVNCHEAQNAPTECDTCHTAGQDQQVAANGPWQVTHGPAWEQTHGMGDQATCHTCHPADFCSKCHGVPVPHPIDFGATHGQYAIENTSDCLVCHKSQEQFCDACHGMEMPHQGEFLEDHRVIANGRVDARCIRCHVASDCDACHALHVHPGGSQGVPVPWTYTPEVLRP